MRVYLVIVIAIAILFEGINALPASTDAEGNYPTVAVEQRSVESKRFLRTSDANSSTEERGPINVDIILKDAAISVKKATKWKAQFAYWKLINKKPETLGQEWGLAQLGRAMRSHKKWSKLKAYRSYYNK
jgi:hypothetical protein